MEINERQRFDRNEQLRLEKQKDKEMIERIVAKERQLIEFEKMMKDHEREEAKRVLNSIKNRSSEMAAYERELDRLIDEERKKRERKEDEAW